MSVGAVERSRQQLSSRLRGRSLLEQRDGGLDNGGCAGNTTSVATAGRHAIPSSYANITSNHTGQEEEA